MKQSNEMNFAQWLTALHIECDSSDITAINSKGEWRKNLGHVNVCAQFYTIQISIHSLSRQRVRRYNNYHYRYFVAKGLCAR